jgi:undecaprenyl-diphosphatase
MPSISALILGLVQGLTEFLPVSSSGHLVLASELLDYQSPGLIMETAVHVATMIAVIIYFRSRFASVIKGVFNDIANRRLVLMVFLAFVVTSIIGLALSSAITAAFESPVITGGMLLITAIALVSIQFIRPGPNPGSLLDTSWKVALIVGLAQGLAIFPGISRSGLTIIAGLWAGQSRTSAAEFSFLLAVPTLTAASLFSVAQEWTQGSIVTSADSVDILAAGVVAFLTGLVAIHWLMRWLASGRLWWFSGYCALVGGLSVVLWGFNLV